MPVLQKLAMGFVLAGVMMTAISCGGPSVVPRAEIARSSLETALTAWRDGKKPGDLAQQTPPIQVVDNEWTTGRKLSSFEIGAETPSEADKRFTVKLNYANSKAEESVTYVIIGTDPVAVYREADFLRTLNMDNNPKAPAQKRRN